MASSSPFPVLKLRQVEATYDLKIDNFVRVCNGSRDVKAVFGENGVISITRTSFNIYIFSLNPPPKEQPLSYYSLSLIVEDEKEEPILIGKLFSAEQPFFGEKDKVFIWPNGQLWIRVRVQNKPDKQQFDPTLSQDLAKEDLGYSDFTLVKKCQIMSVFRPNDGSHIQSRFYPDP